MRTTVFAVDCRAVLFEGDVVDLLRGQCLRLVGQVIKQELDKTEPMENYRLMTMTFCLLAQIVPLQSSETYSLPVP